MPARGGLLSLCSKWTRKLSYSSPRLAANNHLASEQQYGQRNNLSDSNGTDIRITNRLKIAEPAEQEAIAAYRVLGTDGLLIGELEPSLDSSKILDMYQSMITLNSMDRVMFDAQRQGRISFYMTSFGEEAVQLGSAGALRPDDWIFAQYREAGLLLHRKMTLRLLMAQCYGNSEDLGKGRQMPIHYGNRSLNYVTISSTLATQMPQAAGTAYALKRSNMNDPGKQVVACFFGEGAASEGDAHAAMNFAATLSCPVLFVCRNNQYAISTPASEQYRGDGIVSRASGYGMASIRVDGNDLFAVYAATKAARDLAAKEQRPVLIEAMTYRVGHHSTSDNSFAYRTEEEVKSWQQQVDPLQRVRDYLSRANLWSEEQEKRARSEARAQVLEALAWAEKLKKPSLDSMFEDVYDEQPENLRRQREELMHHLNHYGQHYPVDQHETK